MEKHSATIKNLCKFILNAQVLKDVRQGKSAPSLKKIFDTTKITPDDLKDRLVAILSLVKECSNEIEFVERALVKNDFAQSPLMKEVWYGDAYGVGEERGVRELIKDLEGTKKIVETPEAFCEFIVNDI
jgi:hypothetical protein